MTAPTPASKWSNFTLEADETFLFINDVTAEAVYTAQVAAYNRKGIGPFSLPATLKVESDLLVPNAIPPLVVDQHDTTATMAGSETTATSGLASLELVVQEVWFVTMIAIMVLLVLVAFVATICVKRKRTNVKSLGHYNGKLDVIF